MEEKIVENKKEGSSFSWSLSLSCIYRISHLSIYLLSLPTIYHPTLVHRQHRILCSLWTSNTRLASPILTEDTSGMVRSTTDRNKGTAPPKPIRKIWTIGSISADDKGFLEWRKDQSLMSHGCTVLEGMVHYVNQLNFESEERYEREMKEYKALPLSAANNDTCNDPDQTAEPAKLKALDDTSNTNMNIPTPQILPPHISQNIPEHSSQEQSTPLIPEHSSRNIPVLSPPSSVPTTAPRTEQSLDE